MRFGAKIDEAGMLLHDGGGFQLRRDAGRFRLDLRRTPADEVEKRVRVTGNYVGDELVEVDGALL